MSIGKKSSKGSMHFNVFNSPHNMQEEEELIDGPGNQIKPSSKAIKKYSDL